MAVDREVIEEQLDGVIEKFLALIAGKEMLPGWRALFMLGVEFHGPEKARAPFLQEDQLDRLLGLAESWPDAFDAAGYMAGMALAAGIPMPSQLSMFAGEVLAGERKRPVQRGRPLSDGKLRALYQYALVLFLHEKADLPIARNRELSGSGNFNACEAVAAAFTRAGHRTTFEQVASLVYDTAHADLRQTAKSLGLLDFENPTAH